jgi:uncharacterized membrane protein
MGLKQMKTNCNRDLILINAFSSILIFVKVFFPGSPLRTALGIPFLLFFPGYSLMSAFYPKNENLDLVQRLALSTGLSLVVVPLIGLGLNYTPLGIRLGPIIISFFLFTLLMSIVSFYRGRRFSDKCVSWVSVTHSLGVEIKAVGLFSIAMTLFILYLMSIRWHIHLPVIIFWMAILLMLGIIIYQILKIDSFPFNEKIVLLEIMAVGVAFHLIYQIPYYGIYGYDAYSDLFSAKGLLSSGFVMGDPRFINPASYFPLIHMFGVIFSLVTNLNLWCIAKWMPSFLDGITIALLYFLVLSIFNDKRIALFTALLFASLQNHILFSSLFIRQTYALILTALCIYLYFSARASRHPAGHYTLSTICLLLIVLAHHLTSFLTLIFISIHFILTKTLKVPFFKRTYFKNVICMKDITATFILIAFVANLAYWIYIVMSPLYSLTSFVRSLIFPEEWGVYSYSALSGISAASIQTVRGYIIFYGFYFFHLIFALILFHELLKARTSNLETYSFILFFFCCMLLGFLTMYVVKPEAYPDRFLTYGWLFGFAPLTATLLKNKHKWLERIGVFMLIGFILFNIYMIEPTAWDAKAEGAPTATSEEDYGLADTIDFSNGTIFGSQTPLMAIYDRYCNLGKIWDTRGSVVDLTNFDYIIIDKNQLEIEKKYYPNPRTETTAALRALANGSSSEYNKIYESNSILVFKP